VPLTRNGQRPLTARWLYADDHFLRIAGGVEPHSSRLPRGHRSFRPIRHGVTQVVVRGVD